MSKNIHAIFTEARIRNAFMQMDQFTNVKKQILKEAVCERLHEIPTQK
jgi:ribosomal protein S8